MKLSCVKLEWINQHESMNKPVHLHTQVVFRVYGKVSHHLSPCEISPLVKLDVTLPGVCCGAVVKSSDSAARTVRQCGFETR